MNRVGPARVVWHFGGELVHHPDFIAPWLVTIDKVHENATGLTTLLFLHRHATRKQFVKRSVGQPQRWMPQVHRLGQYVFPCSIGLLGIQPSNRLAHSKRQHLLQVVRRLRFGAVVGNVRAIAVQAVQLGASSLR